MPLWTRRLRERVLGRVSRLERWFSIRMMWSEIGRLLRVGDIVKIDRT